MVLQLCEARTSFCLGLISRKLCRFLLMFSAGSGYLNVHHKDWFTHSGGTDRYGKLCYNFSISNDLTQMVNFPTQIPDCDSHIPALLD